VSEFAIEKGVTILVYFRQRRTLPNNEYGKFIHGGGHTYWTYYKTPPFAGIHRVWINGHLAGANADPYLRFDLSATGLLLCGVNKQTGGVAVEVLSPLVPFEKEPIPCSYGHCRRVDGKGGCDA